jgi:6-phosphogluconolactonase
MLCTGVLQKRRTIFLLPFLALLCLTTPALAQQNNETVYVMTNRAQGNSVQVYQRASNSLNLVQEVPTQGLGTGFSADPLGSQGALALRSDGKILVAVNPASGDITAFLVSSNGLTFGSKVASGGAFPVSVTVHGSFVYVLNQLGTPNIAGFTVDGQAQLKPIAQSAHALAGGPLAQPAEVSFTPDGTRLLVTEKGTDLIDVFAVKSDGTVTEPIARPSAGKTPFGFAFASADAVVVTEASRRLPLRASVSSYHFGNGDPLSVLSAAVPNHQSGACWAAVTGDTAWVVNTGTSTISAYQIGSDGSLILANPVATATGPNAGPIDIAATNDGQVVYVLESNVGAVAAFQVNGNSLTPLFVKSGLPLSIQGLAVR